MNNKTKSEDMNKLVKWSNDGYPPIDLNNELRHIVSLVADFKAAQSEIAKLKEIDLVAAVTRRGVFFIENKETHRWVIPRWGANFDGDHQTTDPYKAEKFETMLEALMLMKNEGFKMDQWKVTEHEFVNN